MSTRGTSPSPYSTVIVAGPPLAAIELPRLPSVNDYITELGRHATKGGQFEKRWRVVGHRSAENFIAKLKASRYAACSRADGTTGIRLREPVCEAGAFFVFKVWKGTNRQQDSALNLYTKPIIDGFVDAGLIPDDNDRHVLGALPIYCGVAGVARVVAELHHVSGSIDPARAGVRFQLSDEEVAALLRRPDPVDYSERAAAMLCTIDLDGDPRTAIRRTSHSSGRAPRRKGRGLRA